MTLVRARVFSDRLFTSKKEEETSEDAALISAYATIADFLEYTNSGQGALCSGPRLFQQPFSVADDKSTQGSRTEVVPQ